MSLAVDKLLITDLNKGDEFWSFQKNSTRDYVHNLFTYPAMMVPQMQREIISIFKARLNTPELTIYDPFMGSGTVLVEGMLQGLNIVGVDINPLAYLVSKVKTTIYSIPRLKQSVDNLLRNLNTPSGSTCDTHFHNIDKWFKKEICLELDHIKKQILLEPSKKMRRYFWVALSETIRSVSNSRSYTYKLHIKDKKDIDAYKKSALDVFLLTLEKNLHSTITFQDKLNELNYISKTPSNKNKYIGKINLYLGNTTELTTKLCKKFKPNLIITSPPYGDNHTTVTYGQYSVLALRWINLLDIDIKIDTTLVETLSKIDSISMGGKVNDTINKNTTLFSPSLQNNLHTITKNDNSKVDKVITFYNDFCNFISKLSHLREETYVIMTVGNRCVAKERIAMDRILIEYFEHFSFKLIHKFERNILNKRMPIVNHTNKKTGERSKTMTKEHVLILKKG